MVRISGFHPGGRGSIPRTGGENLVADASRLNQNISKVSKKMKCCNENAAVISSRWFVFSAFLVCVLEFVLTFFIDELVALLMLLTCSLFGHPALWLSG